MVNVKETRFLPLFDEGKEWLSGQRLEVKKRNEAREERREQPYRQAIAAAENIGRCDTENRDEMHCVRREKMGDAQIAAIARPARQNHAAGIGMDAADP